MTMRARIGAAGVAVLVVALWVVTRSPSPGETPGGSTDDRPAVTVRVVEAKLGSVQAWVFAEGNARSSRREYLMFENPGRVAFIAEGPDGGELREGDPVEAGMLLAHQDQRRYESAIRTEQASHRESETRLAVARAELTQAETERDLAQSTFRRFEVLLEKKSASEQEFDEAEAQAAKAAASVSRAESQVIAARAGVDAAEARLASARVDLEATELRSPIDGVVAYLNIEEGYYFMPSLVRTDDETAALQTVPMVVIDPSVFEITVNVPSYERQRIQPGQTVLITTGDRSLEAETARSSATAESLDARSSSVVRLPGSAVRGEVHSVNPAISPGGRAIQVKIRAAVDDRALEDGMFVTVWIAAEERSGVVVAPLEAFSYRDNRPFVFVVDDASQKAELRPVTLGLQGLGVQEIVRGVEAGERLVTEGRFQLSDGTRVEILADGEGAAATQASR